MRVHTPKLSTCVRVVSGTFLLTLLLALVFAAPQKAHASVPSGFSACVDVNGNCQATGMVIFGDPDYDVFTAPMFVNGEISCDATTMNADPSISASPRNPTCFTSSNTYSASDPNYGSTTVCAYQDAYCYFGGTAVIGYGNPETEVPMVYQTKTAPITCNGGSFGITNTAPIGDGTCFYITPSTPAAPPGFIPCEVGYQCLYDGDAYVLYGSVEENAYFIRLESWPECGTAEFGDGPLGGTSTYTQNCYYRLIDPFNMAVLRRIEKMHSRGIYDAKLIAPGSTLPKAHSLPALVPERTKVLVATRTYTAERLPRLMRSRRIAAFGSAVPSAGRT